MTADYRPALTILQPWASAIVAGIKTVETRPRRSHYRGPLVLHAGMSDHHLTAHDGDPAGCHGRTLAAAVHSGLPLTRGAIIGSAVVTDCVPIGHDHPPPPNPPRRPLIDLTADGRSLMLWAVTPDDNRVLTAELPHGNFSSGRWALLLDDIKATTDRCPWCWGEGGWGDGSADQCWCCLDVGRCDPIPAKGNQAVPWRWRP